MPKWSIVGIAGLLIAVVALVVVVSRSTAQPEQATCVVGPRGENMNVEIDGPKAAALAACNHLLASGLDGAPAERWGTAAGDVECSYQVGALTWTVRDRGLFAAAGSNYCDGTLARRTDARKLSGSQ